MSFKIKEQPNVFDDHFLDIIGNEFKFDHVKGLAEWMKNSADAYTRENVPDDRQSIYLRFVPRDGSRPARFECVDFVGMSNDDIDKAFKRWGDPRAASRDTGRRTLGGHGNGGKFYMRQMFKVSQFVTYRDGKLNVFGFNERKRYGYADGYQAKRMSEKAALEFAGLSNGDVPKDARQRWAQKGVGFTVVMGEGPEKMKGWRQTLDSIAKRIRLHPQARRLVKHKQVCFLNGEEPMRLLPEEIPPREDFDKPRKHDMPAEISHGDQKVVFRNKKYPKAHLTLYTSAQPFSRIGERSSLNSIDIMGEVGCIGSYRLNELGYLKHAAQAEFVYGECYCPILEDEEDDCVRNDREKLVDTEKTQALLDWIRGKVDELCEEIAEKDRTDRKKTELRQSSAFNELLNRWKNKFMSKLFGEILGGQQAGDSWGGLGGGGEFGKSKGKGGKGDGAKGGDRGEGGGGSGTEPKRAPRFPRVLLSGFDTDPLHPESTDPLMLDPGHPPVYQRFEDVSEGIYWINTARPLAQRTIEQYGVKSTRWREYLFQRYVDIIIKEAIYQKAKKEPTLTAEMVDSLIDEIIGKVHDAAAQDLESFLFEEAFGVSEEKVKLEAASTEA